jgi:hypothetical protein
MQESPPTRIRIIPTLTLEDLERFSATTRHHTAVWHQPQRAVSGRESVKLALSAGSRKQRKGTDLDGTATGFAPEAGSYRGTGS